MSGIGKRLLVWQQVATGPRFRAYYRAGRWSKGRLGPDYVTVIKDGDGRVEHYRASGGFEESQRLFILAHGTAEQRARLR